VTVLVVGGGITGLASAYALGRAGVPVILLEASSRLGGKVRTEMTDGYVIEHGPDSFVSYRPAALELDQDRAGRARGPVRPLPVHPTAVAVGGAPQATDAVRGHGVPMRGAPWPIADVVRL